MEISSVEELFAFDVSRALGAEETILENLKETLDVIENEDFRSALQEHVRQTEGQIESLRKVLEAIGEGAQGAPTSTMEGVIQDLDEALEKVAPELQDAVVAAAMQKVEYIEIATYKSLATTAEQMGNREVVRIINDICQQEEAMAKRIEQFSSALVTAE